MHHVYVTHQFEGYHRWLEAPSAVIFLRDYHRHIFHVKLTVRVKHGNRDVEFFILQRHLKDVILLMYGGKHFNHSCEQIAEYISLQFTKQDYDVVSVEVSEDGENGAIYYPWEIA